MNKTIGLGLGDNIDLWVEILEVSEEFTTFHVINGAWDGHFTIDGILTCYTPWGNTIHKIDKYFLDPIPNFGHRNYNEAIAWMNGEVFDIEPFLAKTVKFEDWDDDIAF